MHVRDTSRIIGQLHAKDGGSKQEGDKIGESQDEILVEEAVHEPQGDAGFQDEGRPKGNVLGRFAAIHREDLGYVGKGCACGGKDPNGGSSHGELLRLERRLVATWHDMCSASQFLFMRATFCVMDAMM